MSYNPIILVYSILQGSDWLWSLFTLMPLILGIELPFYLFIVISVTYQALKTRFQDAENISVRYPMISCIIPAYAERKGVLQSLHSLLEQRYPGPLEIMVIIDGSNTPANIETYRIVQSFINKHQDVPNRYFKVIQKKTRGGHASSLNLGLSLAKGELILSLDADTSCDNDALIIAAENFMDSHLMGLSGSLRVRNAKQNLLTRMQAMEYLLGIQMGRMGLGLLNVLNNISSAFGLFRRDFLQQIGGWKNGSAEDFDLTIRIQSYFRRYPHLKLGHDSSIIAHTEVPTSLKGLLKQRLRWEGDLFFILCRRHWRALNPKQIGWRRFIVIIWSDLFMLMITPISISAYMLYLFIHYSFIYAFTMFILVYLYYIVFTLSIILTYWFLVSERKRQDALYFLYLPFLPFYHFSMRLWAAFAILAEIVFSTHKDSTMAPWWVLKKAK